MDNDDPLKKVPFFTAVHPDNERCFREIAASKKDIRTNRSNIGHACSNCTKLGNENTTLLKCARCKIAWYCSKECQKQQWPIHKRVCNDASSSLPKLINSFVVNPLLSHFLQLAFVLEFKLHEKLIVSKPFLARCDVSIDPADMTYIMRLVMGRVSDAELAQGTQGMLQIKSFIPQENSQTLDQNRMGIWRNVKKGNEERGLIGRPVGLVDFYMKNTVQTLTVGILIQEDAVERVNEGVGFQMESALLPGRTDVKLSRQSCLDFINTHIRSDKGNQLRLRTHMSKQDVEKLRSFDDDKDEN